MHASHVTHGQNNFRRSLSAGASLKAGFTTPGRSDVAAQWQQPSRLIHGLRSEQRGLNEDGPEFRCEMKVASEFLCDVTSVSPGSPRHLHAILSRKSVVPIVRTLPHIDSTKRHDAGILTAAIGS